jgi:hypothetical protein
MKWWKQAIGSNLFLPNGVSLKKMITKDVRLGKATTERLLLVPLRALILVQVYVFPYYVLCTVIWVVTANESFLGRLKCLFSLRFYKRAKYIVMWLNAIIDGI